MPTTDRLPRSAPFGEREATEEFIAQSQQRNADQGGTPQATPEQPELPLAAPPGGVSQAGTAFPDEPVTAGLPIGAGPGPEALPTITPPRADRTEAELWGPLLPVLEVLADQEGASGSTLRQMIRRVRSQQEPDAHAQHVARGSTRQPGVPETQPQLPLG